ncbi:DUF983 domain-containing protein [Aureibaculum algae]|nr:DUF983 domain-containing protein [Aureibaculum algae]
MNLYYFTFAKVSFIFTIHMFKKGTKIYSIFNNKCPKCNEGAFFEDNNPLHLKKVLKMNEHCPNCNFKYEIEPSFFFGAMYVSYGLTVGCAIVTFIILYLTGLDLMTIFITIFVLLVLFTPFTLRFARLIYANIFIHYDKNYKTIKKPK